VGGGCFEYGSHIGIFFIRVIFNLILGGDGGKCVESGGKK